MEANESSEKYIENRRPLAKRLADTGRFGFLKNMTAKELTARYYLGPDLGVDYPTLVLIWQEVRKQG